MQMIVGCLAEVCLTCCRSYWLPFIFITIYGVVCVQLDHFSLGDWKDISIAHVIIIIKSEVSTFPIVIFFRGCVPKILYIIFCYILHIHSGKTGNLFLLLLCSLWWVQIVGYTFWLDDRIRLFVQYTISLSSLCKLIWRHWMPVRYILSSVWVG